MRLVILAFSILIFSQAFAVSEKCYNKAAKAVVYAGEEAEALNCELAPNGKVVVCEVAAYKGGGEASDTWEVVLNKDCTKVYRTKMTGEE